MALDSGVEVAAIVDVSSSAGGDAALMTWLQGEGVELYTSHTVKEATGETDDIESVVLVEIDENNEPVAGSEKVIAADTVCLAIGLAPNIELLSLLGCDLSFRSELGGYVPDHDDWMRTSVDNVYVAGRRRRLPRRNDPGPRDCTESRSPGRELPLPSRWALSTRWRPWPGGLKSRPRPSP